MPNRDPQTIALMRNRTEDGLCKYALIRLDKMREEDPQTYGTLKEIARLQALGGAQHNVILPMRFVELAGKNDPEEAFVLKLKDRHSTHALRQYATEHLWTGCQEFGMEIQELAQRAFQAPNRRDPD